jgi:hypothetical protein
VPVRAKNKNLIDRFCEKRKEAIIEIERREIVEKFKNGEII